MAGNSRDDELAPTQVGTPTPPSDAASDASSDATVRASDPAPAARPSTDASLVGKSLGRYEIEYLIGRGGMGEVYAAYDPNLDRPVAIKVLLAGIRGEGQRARLVREAQALARLQHANVVAVYDAGEDGGHVFIAMQYVEGDTLAAHLRTTPRPWAEVVALYIAAGRGLSAAHAAGIVHRDFKPSNVLVDRTGHVAVTDFGIARHSGDPIESPARPSDPSGAGRKTPRSDPAISVSRSPSKRPSKPSHELTRVGELVGTPAYMPIEQLEGRTVTAATDQFAFCVALWEALFGVHPYAGETVDNSPLAFGAALDRGVLHLPDRHPVPRRVVAALSRGLSRDPAQRWPSMDALLAELTRGARPRRTLWIAAAAAVVVAGGATAAVLVIGGSDRPSCEAIAKQRATAVWGPAVAEKITNAFMATGRPYAATAANAARDRLGAYATGWTAASVDVCTASRSNNAGERRRAERRASCLDGAYSRLVATVAVLGDKVGGEGVDVASSVLGDLPPLADCAFGDGPVPSAAIAKKVADFEIKLDHASLHGKLGLPRQELETLTALTPDVLAIGWPGLEVRLDYYIAQSMTDNGVRAYPALSAIARRAHVLGELRIELWALAVAMETSDTAAELDAVVSRGQAVAENLAEPEAKLQVALANATGLLHLRRFKEASSLCRDGRTIAKANHWNDLEERATLCLVAALVPLGQNAELGEVLPEALATLTARVGAEHPVIATVLEAQGAWLQDQGKYEEAESVEDRILAIRRRAYGDNDVRTAAAIRAPGETAGELGDDDKAKAMYEQALATDEGLTPPPAGELWKLHRNLGMLAVKTHDVDGIRAHFDKAIEYATQQNGADSIEVAFLMVMYGQYQTIWDVDAGFATLRRSIEIFAAHDDPRAAVARGALGGMLLNEGRTKEAAEVLEEAVQHANYRDTAAALIGQMAYSLAKALLANHEPQHARQHAEDAVAAFARANDLATREEVRDWIHDHHLPAYDTKFRDPALH